MTVVRALEIGILGGFALFFVLLRLGVIDRWFESWERIGSARAVKAKSR